MRPMTNMILNGHAVDSLRSIPNGQVHCCVTSPPYYGNLRDYGESPQKWGDGWIGGLGCEANPAAYIRHLMDLFSEVMRVLHPSGLCFVNIGDTYASTTRRVSGYKCKDIIGIPWMLAFAMRESGWYWRGTNIWHKPNQMPASYVDRCVTDYEPIHQFSKSEKYFFDHIAIQEPASKNQVSVRRRSRADSGAVGTSALRGSKTGQSGNGMNADINTGTRSKRSVWTINTHPRRGDHFAVFPDDIPETCIKAGTSARGCCPGCLNPWVRSEDLWLASCACEIADPIPCTVLDPFLGSGTTAAVAKRLGRNWIGCELNPDYVKMAHNRISFVDDGCDL